jgi:eukaryotic-like serine/threonine-protein kinase
MFKFITGKPLWVNVCTAIVLAFLMIFLVLQLLGWITKHGAYLTVPSIKGKNTMEAIRLLESKGFDVTIQDSIYTDSLPRGTVIKQLPDADATVKVNRTVFITVNRYVPPMITMPALEGKSMNFALEILAKDHFVLEDTIYTPNLMKGYILEQKYNGSPVAAGTKLQWGSKITLIVGGGVDENNMTVPDVVGLTYEEAKLLLDSMGIVVNPVPTMDLRDTLHSFVYKTIPPHMDEDKHPLYIRSGMFMDLFISPTMIHLTDSIDNKKTKTDK